MSIKKGGLKERRRYGCILNCRL